MDAAFTVDHANSGGVLPLTRVVVLGIPVSALRSWPIRPRQVSTFRSRCW